MTDTTGTVVSLSDKRAEKSLNEIASTDIPGQVSTIDIAATYHRMSSEIAATYGVTNGEEVCAFDALHPVMASLLCETFEQMIELGIIIPGSVNIIPADGSE